MQINQGGIQIDLVPCPALPHAGIVRRRTIAITCDRDDLDFCRTPGNEWNLQRIDLLHQELVVRVLLLVNDQPDLIFFHVERLLPADFFP